VRVEAAVGVDRRVERQADVRRRAEDAAMNSQPAFDRPSLPFLSWKRFTPFFDSDMLVCMPLPLTPVTGLGRNDAVMPSWLATWRARSL
jgi:hypothetical protein